MSRQPAGFVLAPTLLLIALAALLMATISRSSMIPRRNDSRKLTATLGVNEAAKAALKSIFRARNSTPGVRCLDAKSRGFVREICFAMYQSPPGVPLADGKTLGEWGFPAFRYGEIFEDARVCANDLRDPPNLTPNSLRSLHTCIALEKSVERVIGNLNFSEIEIAVPKTILGSTGYIQGSVLRISAPTLILAGGDITIASLESYAPGSSTVTLISATGQVRLGAVDPAIRISVIARKGFHIPQGTKTSRGALPPVLAEQLLSLGSPSES